MEVHLPPPPAHRNRRIADDTAAEDGCTAEFSARPLRRRCYGDPGEGAASGSDHKRNGSERAHHLRFRRRRNRPPGHRVVVTVCKVSLLVSALMKVRSTAPQGVGAQALPLPGEYLVGWSSAPRIWAFACG